MLKIPAFCEENYTMRQANSHCRICRIPDAQSASFDAYVAYAKEEGFAQKEVRHEDFWLYAAMQNGTQGLFLNYFVNTGELFISLEEECGYFEYTDPVLPSRVTPQITQVMLEDFGLSFVIRLSDGRFIVIDGGVNFKPHSERLLACLKKGSPDQKPVIAAWIMSHPHSDHFHCFIGFMDLYADEVVIEKFLFYFPEADDLAHYPKLEKSDPRFDYPTAGTYNIPRMLERMKATGAPIYTAHTGQTYRIGDAVCEILACMDDTIHLSQNINATSLVIRMELGGQVILWATDASFEYARVPDRYGSYLKSDILQIPHHGFQSGSPEDEIRGYDLIQPRVCLLAVSDYNAYTAFCTYRKSFAHLMDRSCVEEVITGTPQRTIELPYTPPAYAKRDLEARVREGRENSGAHTWVFSNLSTACAEDFEFCLLNMSKCKAEIWIELFFEDPSLNIRNIKAEVASGALKQVSLVGDSVDGDALYFNWMSLKQKGIPENQPFAARFISNVPVVITSKAHTASYCRV